jgi:murein DD-endopeptidase MepM/ murein hydrolase activator NlpD
VNNHVVSASQRYALDILKLNSVGLRARGFYPADLERYAIFGVEVVSPCDGLVAAAEDGFADYSPPERDPEHRAGNYIAIEYDGATIYLAHLMKGSICVKSGDRVCKGQVLGRVGNSGNTTEPHLHIHVEEGLYSGQFSGKRGIPIRFNGKFLVRNDRVKA